MNQKMFDILYDNIQESDRPGYTPVSRFEKLKKAMNTDSNKLAFQALAFVSREAPNATYYVKLSPPPVKDFIGWYNRQPPNIRLFVDAFTLFYEVKTGMTPKAAFNSAVKTVGKLITRKNKQEHYRYNIGCTKRILSTVRNRWITEQFNAGKTVLDVMKMGVGLAQVQLYAIRRGGTK
ncbi:hypothetical protein ABT925_000221 [Salmonella enterica subsp. enterica serovar Give]